MVTRWLITGEKYDLMKDCSEASELVVHGVSYSDGLQKCR
jgi:hypothetical protein